MIHRSFPIQHPYVGGLPRVPVEVTMMNALKLMVRPSHTLGFTGYDTAYTAATAKEPA